MVRVRSAIWWVCGGLCAGALVAPGAASAGNGGASAPGGGAQGPKGVPTITAGTLAAAPASLIKGQTAVLSGALPAGEGGHTIWLQVLRGATWKRVATATAAAGGGFAISWVTSTVGRLELRVVTEVGSTGTGTAVAASSLATTTPATLSVYRAVEATWYGPGFYGRHTACGETLTRELVGVASRTLPCGTPVSLSFDGRTLTLPVIDRGPYTRGLTLDLTHAAAQELGMAATSQIGMLRLVAPAMAPTSWTPAGGGATGATGPTSTAGGATAPTG
jgi:peptidoglycan lytic transglycosylase